MSQSGLLRIAVIAPVGGYFDYLPPRDSRIDDVLPGIRVRVPFGRARRIGVVVGTGQRSSLPPSRLKRVLELIDDEPLIDADLLGVLEWVASYYRQPPGEVFAAALPKLLRVGRAAEQSEVVLLATPEGQHHDLEKLRRKAPRQSHLLELVQRSRDGLSAAELTATQPGWQRAMSGLEARTLVRREIRTVGISAKKRPLTKPGPALNDDQAEAVNALSEMQSAYHAVLLQGVTGSGKTEVYLRAIEELITRDRQALVLVPEISLTPQLIARFVARFGTGIAALHSALSDRERLAAWRDARSGRASVVLGTRSAVFAPMRSLGIVIVDEEHDPSYKQQERFRYSARDLAVVRARRLDIPVVLGSATPSLETLQNVAAGRYHKLLLPKRIGTATEPSLRLIDLRSHGNDEGLSTPLVMAIRKHVDEGGQVLLYLNRRGYAPALYCTRCGKVAECNRCDAKMTVHLASNRLRCHHCGAERRLDFRCSDCVSDPKPVGQGTERVEQALARIFPEFSIERIDRDSMRRRGALEQAFDRFKAGAVQILIGTQMLTKGHHFPDVSLVGVLNADAGLFSTDFRASERLAQTIVQVAGRAGRAERPGEVLIQTSYPDHPLLQQLLNHGYEGFAELALEERRAADWPPFTHLAMLRAEATQKITPYHFLNAAIKRLGDSATGRVVVLGPAAAPMARKAGKYRAHLLLQSHRRRDLSTLLEQWIPGLAELPEARKVRWSIDVDPLELY